MKAITFAILILIFAAVFSTNAAAQRTRRITASPAGGNYTFNFHNVTDGTSNTMMSGNRSARAGRTETVDNNEKITIGRRPQTNSLVQGNYIGTNFRSSSVRVAMGDVNGDGPAAISQHSLNSNRSVTVGADREITVGGIRSKNQSIEVENDETHFVGSAGQRGIRRN